jgi:hypothetical protein
MDKIKMSKKQFMDELFYEKYEKTALQHYAGNI